MVAELDGDIAQAKKQTAYHHRTDGDMIKGASGGCRHDKMKNYIMKKPKSSQIKFKKYNKINYLIIKIHHLASHIRRLSDSG